MNRTLAEKQVLKKLNIPDFRHLSKDNVVAFASMLDRMDPEVAKKALEQFPDFASTARDIWKEYKSIAVQVLQDGRDDTKEVMDGYNRSIDALEKILNEDDLTFEQKQIVIDKMVDITSQKRTLAKEKAHDRLKMFGIVTGALVTITAALASVLGSNYISGKGNNALEEEDEEDN